MKSLTIVLQNLGRLLGLVLLVLGFLFWAHHGYEFVPLHMGLGVGFTVLLWAIAVLGLRAGVSSGLVVVALIWGLVVIVFGASMGRLLPGRAHELIRVLHFLIGVGAIGLLESIGARIKRSVAVVR